MIDIHTHILYGVDDGSKSLEESLAMLKGMEESGVKVVFLTPHVARKRGYYDIPIFKERFNEIKKAAQSQGLKIKLCLGSEVDESDNLFEDLDQAPNMNGTNVYMVDFGMRKTNIEEIVYESLVKGIPIIVAHPERYFYVDFEMLKAIKKAGALFQVSAPHLIKLGNKDAQKLAQKLLKEDLIDFIGSDTHHQHNDLSVMKKAYKYVVKKKGKDVADKLFYMNAKALMCDYDD